MLHVFDFCPQSEARYMAPGVRPAVTPSTVPSELLYSIKRITKQRITQPDLPIENQEGDNPSSSVKVDPF
jgi:hypothetical protein